MNFLNILNHLERLRKHLATTEALRGDLAQSRYGHSVNLADLKLMFIVIGSSFLLRGEKF
jgi:hypothetical protein